MVIYLASEIFIELLRGLLSRRNNIIYQKLEIISNFLIGFIFLVSVIIDTFYCAVVKE